ncbi:MAG: UvrD-helicase domain-containing protein [Candidatus Binatia bacterium]
MTIVPLADADARARAINELGTTFLLEAGAGTGKTTVLLNRLLSWVRTGRGNVERIAAITFSEKAAAEMRLRLRAELELALAGSLSTQERENLTLARWQLERAQISTVHSFCASLLRERPIEAHVDPGFSLLDQFEATLLQTDVWQEWLTQQMQTGPQILRQALRVGVMPSHLETLRDFLIEQRDCLPLLPELLSFSFTDIQAAFAEDVQQLAGLKKACRNPVDRAFTQIQRLYTLLPKTADRNLWEYFFIREPREVSGGTKVGTKANWQPAATLDQVRAILQRAQERHAHLRSQWLHNLTVGLVNWLCGYLQAYTDKKREHSQLDFTDLLLLTREMLRTNREVRRYFQRKFTCFLVDEFQDTDPLQAEIVFFLAEYKPQADTWTEVTLQPGKLLVVGDPQQSIYRFRRADLQIYAQAREVIARQGEILVLASNFRTRAPVLQWMNTTFAPAFAETAGDQPIYRPLSATREEETGREVLRVVIPQELLSERPTRDEVRHAEACTIAAMLKQAIVYGKLMVWGDQAREYRDVAVLFRSHRALAVYEEAFRSAGIPYRVYGGRRYASRPEVEDMRRLLRVIEYPSAATDMVAVLRSSMFGFRDDELAQFVAMGGRFDSLHPCVSSALPTVERFRAAFTALKDLHLASQRLSPASLLYDVYSCTHLVPVFALRPQGAQRVANLLKLLDIAQALAARGKPTLAALNRFLARQALVEEEEEAILSTEEDNVVHLLTVHKAKGLEFPVVVLADLGASHTHDRGQQIGIIDRLGGVLDVRIGPRALSCTTQGWQEADLREQAQELAEEWRLRYVAAARARDHLILPIVSRTINEEREDPGSFNPRTRNSRLRESFSLSEESEQSRTYTYQVDLQTITQAVSQNPESSLITEVRANTSALHTYEQWRTERNTLLVKGQKSGRGEVLALEGGASVTTGTPPTMTATANPLTLVRTPRFYLQRILQRVLSPSMMTGPQGGKSERREMTTDSVVARLREAVRKSAVMTRAQAATSYVVGVPFAFPYADQVLTGSIDLAFVEGESWVVAHFLIEDLQREQEEENLNGGKDDVSVQALALEQLTGRAVKELVVCSIGAGQERVFPWDLERQRAAHAVLSVVCAVGKTDS